MEETKEKRLRVLFSSYCRLEHDNTKTWSNECNRTNWFGFVSGNWWLIHTRILNQNSFMISAILNLIFYRRYTYFRSKWRAFTKEEKDHLVQRRFIEQKLLFRIQQYDMESAWLNIITLHHATRKLISKTGIQIRNKISQYFNNLLYREILRS